MKNRITKKDVVDFFILLGLMINSLFTQFFGIGHYNRGFQDYSKLLFEQQFEEKNNSRISPKIDCNRMGLSSSACA